jgi:hypothetical protein
MEQGSMSNSGGGQPPERRPALRASDADRERVVDILRRAAGDGRIDVEELDERVSAAYTIRTLTELEDLTLDLVPSAGTRPAQAPGGGIAVRPGEGGTRRIVSIMSGHERRGRWRVARDLLVLSIMGGSELDFHHAELSGETTTIRVYTVMGGAELTFPHGVDVQVSKFALMGGHEVTLDEEPPPPGAPVIHVRLLSLMGGAEVRQGRKPKNWLERKLDRNRPGDRELE